jgi:putative toxin-antitoxin system antitoxin component (TIGR02293 family)
VICVTTATDTLVDLWGGNRVLGRKIRNELDLIPLLREGLPYTTLEHLMEQFGLSREDVRNVLLLPSRTMTRRKQQQRLSGDESDRLYRLSRIMAHALDVFGGRTRAADWMHRGNRALNGETPLSLLNTDIGARQVDDVLGRIEHGVFG